MDDKAEVIGSESDPKQASLEFEFATTTTLHGIGRVAESRGVWGKAPWVFALLVASGFYAAVTFDRISAYLKYDTSTNVIVNFVPSLDFPAVTICNYNRFMNSKIKENDKKHVSEILRVFETYNPNNYDDILESNLTDDLYLDDSFNYTNFAFESGYSLKESMRMCKWKGAQCGVNNFTEYYSPSYGQCYTFTSENTYHNQTLPGIGNGLQLIVDIEEFDYTETKNGNTEAGIKFAIHPRAEMPAMGIMGLSAAPGFHTFASIRQTRHQNLRKPWGVCGTDKAHHKDQDMYSRNTCLFNCRRIAIIDKCNCQPLGYDQRYGTPLCNITQLQCTKKALDVYRARDEAEGTCNCPVSCDYFTFESTISMARYPSLSVTEGIVGPYVIENDTSIYYKDKEYVAKSLVYLDVYYSELSTTAYEQVKDLTFTSLVGELGGQLGLFLGASLITAVEFIDYFVRRSKRLVVKAKKRDNKVHCSMKDLNEASQEPEAHITGRK